MAPDPPLDNAHGRTLRFKSVHEQKALTRNVVNAREKSGRCDKAEGGQGNCRCRLHFETCMASIRTTLSRQAGIAMCSAAAELASDRCHDTVVS